MSWQAALQQVLDTAYETLAAQGIAWTVAGSTSTALQGCQISPGDVELVTQEPESVIQIANLLSTFHASHCDVDSPEDGPWYSTAVVPVFIGSYWGLDWHFGRWIMADFDVEVAHVVTPGGHPSFRGTDGVWDADPQIWSHLRTVPFGGYEVPVIPMEIQIETCFLRWKGFGEARFEERIMEIVRVFKENGYDRSLAEWALRTEHAYLFAQLMFV